MNFITAVCHGEAAVFEDEVPRWAGSCFVLEIADVTIFVLPHCEMVTGFQVLCQLQGDY